MIVSSPNPAAIPPLLLLDFASVGVCVFACHVNSAGAAVFSVFLKTLMVMIMIVN